MKRYEGLFILNNASAEDAIKDTIEKISAEISQAGGKVETVQKMEKKPFSRVADRKRSSGYYVNFVFEGEPSVISQLQHRFTNSEDVFRILFTKAPTPKATA